jgi:hypothetical protein
VGRALQVQNRPPSPPPKKGNLEIPETHAQSWRPRRRRAIQKSGAQITMPLKQQFYGSREFAFQDPEGGVVTIAENVN